MRFAWPGAGPKTLDCDGLYLSAHGCLKLGCGHHPHGVHGALRVDRGERSVLGPWPKELTAEVAQLHGQEWELRACPGDLDERVQRLRR